MDKVQVDENIKELLTSNFDGIMAMEKNSPEIYNAFSKLLSAIDTKYGSGNGIKNLQYLAPLKSTNPNTIPINYISIEFIDWEGQKKGFYVFNWWQFQRAFDFLNKYTDNPTLSIKINWGNGDAFLLGELDVLKYTTSANYGFLGDRFKTLLKVGNLDWFNRTSDKSLYINHLENLDFESGLGIAKELDIFVDGIRVQDWLQAQTYVLTHYQDVGSRHKVEIGVVFDGKYPSDNYINITLDYQRFLANNNLTPPNTQISTIPYNGFVGYIVLDTIRYHFISNRIASSLPMVSKYYDVDGLITVNNIFDYNWGDADYVWRELNAQNPKLLEWNNVQKVQPTTAQSTQQVTIKRGKPITSASSQGTATGMQKYKGSSGWSSDWKARGLRPSPSRSASQENPNALAVGNDSQLYEIKTDKNGTQKWSKYKRLTIEEVSPTSITNRGDLLLAIDILDNMALEPTLDADDIKLIRDQQVNFAVEYEKR